MLQDYKTREIDGRLSITSGKQKETADLLLAILRPTVLILSYIANRLLGLL